MAVIRVQHDHEKTFVQVSRELLKDTSIDLQAKGLLVFMLDKPDNWNVRPRDLAWELKVSKNTVYRILEKLISAHYVARTDIRRRKPDGTFEQASIYDVYENRKVAELRSAEATRHRDVAEMYGDVPF